MVQLFEKAHILEGYRQGDTGKVIELNDNSCKVLFEDTYEEHVYDTTDVCEEDE